MLATPWTHRDNFNRQLMSCQGITKLNLLPSLDCQHKLFKKIIKMTVTQKEKVEKISLWNVTISKKIKTGLFSLMKLSPINIASTRLMWSLMKSRDFAGLSVSEKPLCEGGWGMLLWNYFFKYKVKWCILYHIKTYLGTNKLIRIMIIF